MNQITALGNNESVQRFANRVVQSTWMSRKVFQYMHGNRINPTDTELGVPASHNDGEGVAGAGAVGGGGFSAAELVCCIMIIAGPIMWGVGSASCDDPTFSGWGDPSCDVQNAGAILTITWVGGHMIACALVCCIVAVCCPILCCAAAADGM